MCPSFMATREEEHSTRGRANALRAVMTGVLPPEELTSRRMYEVMDLCLQCKACKTECPSNVDMAKIKTEWLNTYWEANGLTWQARFFAYQPRLARWLGGGTRARLGNWMKSRQNVRVLPDRAPGLRPKTPPPGVSREAFSAGVSRPTLASEGPTGGLLVGRGV